MGVRGFISLTLNLVLFRNINLFLLGSCSICRVRGSVEVCQPVAASYDPSTTNDVAKGNRQQGFYEEIEPGQACLLYTSPSPRDRG